MTLVEAKLDNNHQKAFDNWLSKIEKKYNKYQAAICYAVAATYLDPDLVYDDVKHWMSCIEREVGEAEKDKRLLNVKSREDALKFIENYHNDKIQKEKEWSDQAYDDYSRTVRSDGYQMTLSQETALKEMETAQITDYLDSERKIRMKGKIR